MGGAIVADKAWFYGAARFQENAFYLAGNYYNLNAGDPTKWTYAPDFSRQAEDWITQQAGNGRVTWQASQKHRLSFHYEQQSRDIWSGNALIAPESTGNFMFPKNNFATVGWTAPLSSRLLLEVRGAHRAEEILVACPGQTPERDEPRPGEEPAFDTLIPVREQSLGNFLYRGKGDHNPDPIFHCNHQDIPHMLQAAGTISYVTGTHAFKARRGELLGYADPVERRHRFGGELPVQQLDPEPDHAARDALHRIAHVHPGRAGRLRAG